ncbi:MAG: DUF58 domain-containing protein [Planctomycetia bacterium]|nr:DUF58 domain-containing protein [Planctomycetia bacterium]
MNSEKYLKPSVAAQIKRLDLRARFIVKGFLHGLHRSPFQGFSVEFSEHRRYAPGDDPKDLDWLIYAKTDKYYVKKFEAETNLTGYLLIDQSASMNYTYRQNVTKFDYAVCLAAALAYLMIHQQDPVGLLTFGETIQRSFPPRSQRGQLGNILSILSKLTPEGGTDIARALQQTSAFLKRQSLVMIMSDLLGDEAPILDALRRLAFAGHDVLLLHILDEAETTFPFEGTVDLEDPESRETLQVDAAGFRDEYQKSITRFRETYARECAVMGADYLPLDTSMPFDRALMGYLLQRRGKQR